MQRRPEPATDSHRMQCMEVWGSNSAVDSGVIMAGLDAWVYSRPWHDETSGGDVHYVSSCATGRITRLLLADVSGHGETVSSTASVLRRIMRRYVNHIEQRRFVRMMNRAVSRIDGNRFATSIVASYFAPRSQLIVSNAGHPPPLLHRKRAGRWSFITQSSSEPADRSLPTNMPLGIVRDTEYDEQRLRLEIGDIVLLYSDALIEARNADGDLIGLDGLLELMQTLDARVPGTLVQQLRERVAALHEQNLDGDDLTVLMFRPNGVGGGSNFFTRAWAGLRIIGTAVARLFGGRDPIPWPEASVEAMLGTPIARVVDRLRGRGNDTIA
jgi:hypothetical protein